MIEKKILSPTGKILIAEDNAIDRLLAKEALGNTGFTVVEAPDGAAALEAFFRELPDVVLLDVMMPKLDGFAVCRELRDSDSGRFTPIVMMTSLNDVASVERAFRLGATDFIVKPIHAALLPHRMRYVLRACQTAEALRRSQEELRRAQRTARLGYWRWDAANDEFEWSEEVSRIFGLTPAPVNGSLAEFIDHVHPEDRTRVQQSLQRSRAGSPVHRIDYRIKRQENGRLVHQEGSWEGEQLSGIMQDITDLRLTDQYIHQLAYFDSVTGLHNRAHLRDNLDETLARARRYQHSVAVLFLDLDRFKEINDSLGHSAGDLLLKQVAGRLLECVRSQDAVVRAGAASGPEVTTGNGDKLEDTVVRLGGDEFVIVAGEIARPADAARLCRRIIAMLCKPFQLDDHEVTVTASIGVSLYPDHGDNLDVLLKHADEAMYRAKEDGRNGFRFFSPDQRGGGRAG